MTEQRTPEQNIAAALVAQRVHDALARDGMLAEMIWDKADQQWLMDVEVPGATIIVSVTAATE